jgi:hypothetical protein
MLMPAILMVLAKARNVKTAMIVGNSKRFGECGACMQ